MPLTTTHALLPLAVAVAPAKRPMNWKLLTIIMFAAAAPDIDGLFKPILEVPADSVYGHRGVFHSIFAASVAGLLAGAGHRLLGVRPFTAAVLVAASAGSHGVLDMMTDSGKPVAYLWPLSSQRLFAPWRPIHSTPVRIDHLFSDVVERLVWDMEQLIFPTFIAAMAVRVCLTLSSAEQGSG